MLNDDRAAQTDEEEEAEQTPAEKAIEAWKKPSAWFGCLFFVMVFFTGVFFAGFGAHLIKHLFATGWESYVDFTEWLFL